MDKYQHPDPKYIDIALSIASKALQKATFNKLMYGVEDLSGVVFFSKEQIEIEDTKHTKLGKLLYV